MKRFPKKFDFQIEYVKFASTILKQDFDWTITTDTMETGTCHIIAPTVQSFRR